MSSAAVGSVIVTSLAERCRAHCVLPLYHTARSPALYENLFLHAVTVPLAACPLDVKLNETVTEAAFVNDAATLSSTCSAVIAAFAPMAIAIIIMLIKNFMLLITKMFIG
jgi:hypothetical protein